MKTNTTPIQETWQHDFRDFYFETGKYAGRKQGIDGYIDFIQTLLQRKKRETIEAIEKKVKSKLDCLIADTRNNNGDDDYVGGKIRAWEEVLDSLLT